jgi:hypothetical protein
MRCALQMTVLVEPPPETVPEYHVIASIVLDSLVRPL